MVTGQTTSIRIYNSIKDACLSIPEVKQFNLWNNQVSRLIEGNNTPLRFPFVGVQFQNEYNQLSVGRQEINGTFILYICIESLKFKDEDILRFKDNIYQVLTNELPKQGFSDFYRQFELQDADHDNVLIWQQEYSWSYIDDLAADKNGSVKVDPYSVNYNTHY